MNLHVDLLEPEPGPGNVRRVADGGAEFCLTSISHYLAARALHGDLAARFVAVVVQRSPIAALVLESSDISSPGGVQGRRVGGPRDSRLVAELQAALAARGLAPARLVEMDYMEAPVALGRGHIDAVADFVDLVPRTRRLAKAPVRAVPVAPDVYGSGLVAADRVPEAEVRAVRDGLVAALERQRSQPAAGLAALVGRYPEVDADEALEGWRLVEPHIFGSRPTGSMDADTWERTVTHLCAAHGWPPVPVATVFRPELADAAHATARPSPPSRA